MRLHGGLERFLDAQMDLERALAEPHSPSRSQLGRLRNLRQAQDRAVEAHGGILLAGGHRELHVVKPDEPALFGGHGRHSSRREAGPPTAPRTRYEQPLVLPQLEHT